MITFIIYGDIDQISGGYCYDRHLIRALENHGHKVRVSDVSVVEYNKEKTALYIIDELCHPDFYKKKHFNKLQMNIPIVGIVHHLMADENLNLIDKTRHLLQERKFFKRIDFAIFNSQSTANSARQKGHYYRKSVIAVPGRNITGGTAVKTTGMLKLVFIGNLIPRKGIHHVLSALSKIRDMPFTFTIVGDNTVNPVYTKRINRLVKVNQLENRVILTGYVSNEKKKELLEKSDIMIMPSSHEGYGIAYLEAMGSGVIPVAGKSGGAGEIIRHGVNGFLINPNNSNELIKILTLVYKNPTLKARISDNAIKSWRKHPLWEESFIPVIRALEKFHIRIDN